MFRSFRKEPFDRSLVQWKNEGKRRFLIVWNRGLGDIPLSLYAMVVRLRYAIEGAEITFFTRPSLVEGFAMLEGARTIPCEGLTRRGEYRLSDEVDLNAYDVVIEDLDIKHNFQWQIGGLVPRLQWDPSWDRLSEPFELPERAIGVHVQTETDLFYDRDRSFKVKKWNEIFEMLNREGATPVLFGMQPDSDYAQNDIIDLRGKLNLYTLLSLVKNRLHGMIAPDSGILCFTYFLGEDFPLHLCSIWGAPNQGIRKQGSPSPNRLMKHTILSGKDKNVHAIPNQLVVDGCL